MNRDIDILNLMMTSISTIMDRVYQHTQDNKPLSHVGKWKINKTGQIYRDKSEGKLRTM
jgi:hypothetical protein